MSENKILRVALLRHAQTNANFRQHIAHLNGDPPPLRVPEDHDNGLSAYGHLQAFLTGRFLQKFFRQPNGSSALDLMFLSPYRRVQETAMLLCKGMGIWPKSPFFVTDDLRERGTREMEKRSLTDYEFLNSIHDAFSHSGSDPGVLFRTFIESMKGGELIKRFEQERIVETLERRKTPYTESYREVRERVRSGLKLMFSLIEERGYKNVVIVTHGRTMIAVRQVFERFSDSVACSILETEGIPFPPNVGVCLYRKNGKLALEGEPYQFAPELIPNGRNVEIKPDITHEDLMRMHAACRELGLRIKKDSRSRSVIEFPQLARAGNGKKKLARAS